MIVSTHKDMVYLLPLQTFLDKYFLRDAEPYSVDEPAGKEHGHEKRADSCHGKQARCGLVNPPHRHGKIVEHQGVEMNDVDGKARRGKAIDHTAMETHASKRGEKTQRRDDDERVVVAQHARAIAQTSHSHDTDHGDNKKTNKVDRRAVGGYRLDGIEPEIARREVQTTEERDAIATEIVYRP